MEQLTTPTAHTPVSLLWASSNWPTDVDYDRWGWIVVAVDGESVNVPQEDEGYIDQSMGNEPDLINWDAIGFDGCDLQDSCKSIGQISVKNTTCSIFMVRFHFSEGFIHPI